MGWRKAKSVPNGQRAVWWKLLDDGNVMVVQAIDPEDPENILIVSRGAWEELIAGIKAGELDGPPEAEGL